MTTAPPDLVISGGDVLTPEGRERADLVISAGRIASLAPLAPRPPSSTDRTIDAARLVVVPGFVDLQCNGVGGIDLTAEPERLWDAAALLPRWGVTAWLPTIVTAPEDIRRRALAAWADPPPRSLEPTRSGSVGATPLGLHFEGPFLAPERRGAHVSAHLRRPDAALIEGWSRAAGVAMVTLAPELPGALELVARLVEQNVVVSLGHSSATAAQTRAAVDAGARAVTHLFNAMGSLHHREPGLAGVALTDERLTVGLIADGLHVDPTVVDLATRLLGPRLVLVTDAVAALGVPVPAPNRPSFPSTAESTGSHVGGAERSASGAAAGLGGGLGGGGRRAGPRVQLGDAEAVAEDGAVRLADGTLAGSLLSLDAAVANLMAFAAVGLEPAVRAVTETPARLLGLSEARGVIRPGAVGDVVLLDPTPEGPEVVATIIGGFVAYDRSRGERR